MIAIDKIKIGWYEFKEAVGLGDSEENQKMIAQINKDVEDRKAALVDVPKRLLNTLKPLPNLLKK